MRAERSRHVLRQFFAPGMRAYRVYSAHASAAFEEKANVVGIWIEQVGTRIHTHAHTNTQSPRHPLLYAGRREGQARSCSWQTKTLFLCLSLLCLGHITLLCDTARTAFHTHTQTHTHTRARTHTNTHTHTQSPRHPLLDAGRREGQARSCSWQHHPPSPSSSSLPLFVPALRHLLHHRVGMRNPHHHCRQYQCQPSGKGAAGAFAFAVSAWMRSLCCPSAACACGPSVEWTIQDLS